jgi:hypothetical protein
VSCRFRHGATIDSETDYEQEFYDDNDDWNVPMVCMKLLLYYLRNVHILIKVLN